MKYKYLYLLPFIFTLLCCHKEEDLSLPDNFLSIKVEKDFSSADDYSFNIVSIQLNSLYNNLISNVSATVNLGSLLSSTSNFDVNGKAYFYVKSNQTGKSTITITSKDKNFISVVNFDVSYPESINVNNDASMSNKINNRMNLTFNLKRLSGKVSVGLPISLTALDKNGNNIGSFNNISTSDANGNITCVYWLQDTTYLGFVNFKAQVITPNDTITGFNKVLIVN